MEFARRVASGKRRVGIYGGTFDPIHDGHLHLAVEVFERCKLDEVWFCPAWVSPHKVDQRSTPAHHRTYMVELAIRDFAAFRLIDLEMRRQQISYTIDTLRELQKQEGEGCQLHLIISDEIVPTLPRWKEIEEILQIAPLLVGRRSLDTIPSCGNAIIDAAVAQGVVEMPVLQIMARTIRHRLEEELICSHLVPQPVLDYIDHHHLYG